jgi:hypothetical protein
MRHVVRFGPAVPQHALHLVLQVELALFEGDFFDLFGFREVLAGSEAVDSFVKVVVL